jgi:O-antigen/teichoic acid export membrane protein
MINPEWLPHSYPHLLPLVAAWLAFVAATTARGFFTSLFQAMGRYRELFISGTIILPFVLAGIATGPLILGLPGAVLPMAAGELILLVLLAVRTRNLPTAAVALTPPAIG